MRFKQIKYIGLNKTLFLMIVLCSICHSNPLLSQSNTLKQAERLTYTADSFNTQALDLQLKSSQLRQDNKYSRAKKLEKEAKDFELKALDKYFEANTIRYNYYTKEIKKTLSTQSNNENEKKLCELKFEYAKDRYNEILDKRKAYSTDDVKTELNRLNELFTEEQLAIEKLKEAYSHCLNKPKYARAIPRDSVGKYTADRAPIDLSKDTLVSFNYNMIRKIRRYMDSPEGDSALIAYQLPEQFDYEGIKDFIEAYRRAYPVKTQPNERIIDSTLYKTSDKAFELAAKQETEDSFNIQNDQYYVAQENGANNLNQNETEFVVQIAASIIPLTEQKLDSIYNGKREISIRREEGWYKYQTGTTSTYYKAKTILKSINVPDAFIVAYRGDQKLLLWKAILELKNKTRITYFVQIAASLAPLSQEKLNNIYSGDKDVRRIQEEGWYKYQIKAGNTYDAARRLKTRINVHGAFAVAYMNNKKIDIRQAIKITDQ